MSEARRDITVNTATAPPPATTTTTTSTTVIKPKTRLPPRLRELKEPNVQTTSVQSPSWLLTLEGQVSDQTLKTVIHDAQDTLVKLCGRLATHAGINLIRSQAEVNGTTEIQSFIGLVLAGVQKSVVSSLQIPASSVPSEAKTAPTTTEVATQLAKKNSLQNIIANVQNMRLSQQIGGSPHTTLRSPSAKLAVRRHSVSSAAPSRSSTPRSPRILPNADLEAAMNLDTDLHLTRCLMDVSHNNAVTATATAAQTTVITATSTVDPAVDQERHIQHAKVQQQHRIGVRIFNTQGYKAGLAYVEPFTMSPLPTGACCGL